MYKSSVMILVTGAADALDQLLFLHDEDLEIAEADLA